MLDYGDLVAERTQGCIVGIPARKYHASLLRAEWHKTTGARAARWLLAAAALTTIAAQAIPLLFPHNVKQSSTSYLTWAGIGLTRLLPVVLILAMTAEWSQRTARSTFTLEPRRGRVLTAKIVTGLGVSLLGACFALAVSQLVIAVARAAGRDIASGGSWPQLAGSVVFILLTGATGIAFGALLHNTAAAIVTYFALGAAFNLFTIPALEKAGRWVNTGETYGWVLKGQWAAMAPRSRHRRRYGSSCRSRSAWSGRCAVRCADVSKGRCQHEANAADLDQGVNPRPVRR